MTEYESILRDALAELLAIDPTEVSLTTHFAEQGVDSLIGLRLARKVQDALGFEVELEWLFDYPTISELAAFLGQKSAECVG